MDFIMANKSNKKEIAVGRATQYKLYHGDCLGVMFDIEAGSIDAVICDPPYG